MTNQEIIDKLTKARGLIFEQRKPNYEEGYTLLSECIGALMMSIELTPKKEDK